MQIQDQMYLMSHAFIGVINVLQTVVKSCNQKGICHNIILVAFDPAKRLCAACTSLLSLINPFLFNKNKWLCISSDGFSTLEKTP
jgi:hypothetical protein